MEKDDEEWFRRWFNLDYLHLYENHNDEEAQKQVSFLIHQLHLSGNETILDIGCGVGRHSFAFAQKGFSVVGIDISKELITEAQRKLEKHPLLPLKFIQRDMRDLEELGKFDLAINMFTSFGYFKTNEENAAIFAEVRRSLKEGGWFFLDYLHPFHVKQTLTFHEEVMLRGERVAIDKEIVNKRAVKTICFPGRVYKESVALYSKEEVKQMLEAHDLKIFEIWNDYWGNPWRENGDRQLFLCTAS